MMSTLKRNIIFIGAYLVGCGIYLWFDPAMREQTSEMADVLMTVTGIAGLIWANARAFPKIQKTWVRCAARTGAILALYVALHSVVFCYSWQVRPNLGPLTDTHESANQ
jgi:hypothetical protein